MQVTLKHKLIDPTKSMNKKILIGLMILLVICVFFLLKLKKDYEIIEVLDESCKSDQDCMAPFHYMAMSNCPYDSICIKDKCTVICPHPFQGVKIDTDKIKPLPESAFLEEET